MILDKIKQYFNNKVYVKKVTKEYCDEDVYDLTIEEYPNFALSNNIVVHNSCKEGRNVSTTAVLPLRGKVLNVEKASIEKFINSPAIQRIIAAFGTGVGKNFNIDDFRYDKAILLCFTGDTKVKLLNGTIKTFEELVKMEEENPGQEYWVYSCTSDGNIVPGKAKNPRITQQVKTIVEVTLDNDDVYKCTPEHKLMLRNGILTQVSELKIGDSLMPLNTRSGRKAARFREEVYNNAGGGWKPTHRVVLEHFDKRESVRWQVHHIDNNYFNNDPRNLKWVTPSEHAKIHNVFGKYNVSIQHKERVKELHKQGIYSHVYFGSDQNKWNGSEEQKLMLKEMVKDPERKNAFLNMVHGYNKSEKNKETTRAINRRDDVKKLQQRGKIIHLLACLIRKGFNINEEEYIANVNKWAEHIANVPDINKINKLFNGFDEAWKIAKDYEKNELTDEQFKRLTDVENIRKVRKTANISTKKYSIANIGRKMIDRNMEINEKNYMSVKAETHSKAPCWKNIMNYFKSMDEFMEVSKNYNHKIVNIRYVNYEEPVNVYCMTVEDYHNFAVVDKDEKSGIFSSNCDSDFDGAHIRALLLTFLYKYMRPLIEKGYVYAAMPPLYRVIYGKSNSIYLKDDIELNQWRKENKSKIKDYVIQRFKGLGEMDPSELAETVLNFENRTLKKITINDIKEAEDALRICMGTDAASRREFIEENAYKITELNN